MPRKKAADKADKVAENISDLLEFAHKQQVPGGALDLEVEVGCHNEGRDKAARINGEGLPAQLKFLVGRGVAVPRLQEILKHSKE